jgi:hypothetical protein
MVGELPNFAAVADGLGQIGGEEGVLVVEELHGRLVTAKNVKRLNGYNTSAQSTRDGFEGRK